MHRTQIQSQDELLLLLLPLHALLTLALVLIVTAAGCVPGIAAIRAMLWEAAHAVRVWILWEWGAILVSLLSWPPGEVPLLPTPCYSTTDYIFQAIQGLHRLQVATRCIIALLWHAAGYGPPEIEDGSSEYAQQMYTQFMQLMHSHIVHLCALWDSIKMHQNCSQLCSHTQLLCTTSMTIGDNRIWPLLCAEEYV